MFEVFTLTAAGELMDYIGEYATMQDAQRAARESGARALVCAE